MMLETIIPPTFSVEDEIVRLPKLGSIVARLIALMLDYVVLWFIVMLYFALVSALAVLGGVFALPLTLTFLSFSSPTLMALTGAVMGWLYFAGMQSSAGGATLGKYFLGLRVTDEEGERITFLQATIRYWTKILLSTVLLLGYILALFTKRKQALHDLVARTLVIKL